MLNISSAYSSFKKLGIIICSKYSGNYSQDVTYLFVPDPRKIFADVIEDVACVKGANTLVKDTVDDAEAFNTIIFKSGNIIP